MSAKKVKSLKKTSSSVLNAERSGKSKKEREKSLIVELGTMTPMEALVEATNPLLALFSVVNEIYEEPGAFVKLPSAAFTEYPALRDMYANAGRIYRMWIETRSRLDPDFDEAAYREDIKRGKRPSKRTDKERDGKGRRKRSSRTSSLERRSSRKR